MISRSKAKAVSIITSLCMLLTLAIVAVPTTSINAATSNSGTFEDYQYTVGSSAATIKQYMKANTSAPEVLFVPSEVVYPEVTSSGSSKSVTYHSAAVTTLGNGSSSAFTNSKKTQYVFIPEGVATISNYAIYDYNEVIGWSFPQSIKTIATNAFESSFTKTKSIYAASASDVISGLAKGQTYNVSTDVKALNVKSSSELSNGYIYPSGKYYIPSNISSYKATFKAVAEAGYKVAGVTVGGQKAEVASDGTFTIDLAAVAKDAEVTATFEKDASFDMDAYIKQLESAAVADTDDPDKIVYIKDTAVTAVEGGIYDFSVATEKGSLVVKAGMNIKIRNLTIGSEAASGGGMMPPGMMPGGGAPGGAAPGGDNAGGAAPGGDNAGGAAPGGADAGMPGGGSAAADTSSDKKDEAASVYKSLNDAITVSGSAGTVYYTYYNCNIYENAIEGDGAGTDVNGTFKLKDGTILTSLENTTGDSRYEVTIGPAGGTYYARSNQFYKLAETLNTAAITAGKKISAALDYIYEYVGSYSDEGPFYGSYGYSKDNSLVNNVLNLTSKIQIGSNPNSKIGDADCVTNQSAILARFGANITVNGLDATSYSRYDGPKEGSNFWGTNSVILADSYATITANDAKTDGQANAVYATEYSTINLNGGDFNANYSGSHGLYVGYGGTINVNASSKNDTSNRTIKTKITTVDEASTTLATDTGGGVIEASNVEAVAYGLRSAGVYSIGNEDGDVRVYNSIVKSYLDGGFTSASGGLITADNDIIQGVYALKARSGGGNEASIKVSNSKLVSDVDLDALASVGYSNDTSSYKTIDWKNEKVSDTGIYDLTSGGLNYFLDKMNKEVNFASQYYYFGDGNGGGATYTKYAANGDANTQTYYPYANAPGHSGGGLLGVIYFTEGASYPMDIDSCYLYNANYAKHSKESSKLENYLVVSDGGATANVNFSNENSKTKWDKTGEYSETTELYGDIYAGKNQASAVMAAGGVTASYDFVDSYANVSLKNSEWTGSTAGNTSGITLTVDGKSTWYVDGTTKIGKLVVKKGGKIAAPKGYAIERIAANGTYYGNTLPAGTYKNVTIKVSKAASVNASAKKSGSSYKATVSKTAVAKAVKAKAVKSAFVTVKAKSGSKVVLNIKANSADVASGKTLYLYKQASTGKLTKVKSNAVKATKGNYTVTASKGTYLLVSKKTAQAINKSVK